MLGPFATTSRLTPIQQISLAVLSRAACASMSTTSTSTTKTTTTTRDRGDRYGPIEWAQRLQSTNDLEVYMPNVIVIAAFTQAIYHILLVACGYSVSI